VIGVGIDWGGTKIEIVALNAHGNECYRKRIATPRGDYAGCLRAVGQLVTEAEATVGEIVRIGVAIPGIIDRSTCLVKNANSTWLNGKPLQADFEAIVQCQVRMTNDANCLALAEATDGAGRGKAVVFAVILGTGCGAGIALNGRVRVGLNAIAGEWGHNPLPWMTESEYPGDGCYCGKLGCIESWLSGPAFEREYQRASGTIVSAKNIVLRSEAGDIEATRAMEHYEERLARALATIVNVLDPDVILLGGGMSKTERLYRTLPPLIKDYVFGGACGTPILPALHGDAGGAIGAARLWDERSNL